MKVRYEEGIEGSCKGCDFEECCPKSDGIELVTENKGLMHCWEDSCIFKIVNVEVLGLEAK